MIVLILKVAFVLLAYKASVRVLVLAVAMESKVKAAKCAVEEVGRTVAPGPDTVKRSICHVTLR